MPNQSINQLSCWKTTAAAAAAAVLWPFAWKLKLKSMRLLSVSMVTVQVIFEPQFGMGGDWEWSLPPWNSNSAQIF